MKQAEFDQKDLNTIVESLTYSEERIRNSTTDPIDQQAAYERGKAKLDQLSSIRLGIKAALRS
jgi:precorrin-6B methylase 1